MATLDPIGRLLFSEKGIMRDKDQSIEGYKDLWLLYHFYMSAVCSSLSLADNPQDIFKMGRAN